LISSAYKPAPPTESAAEPARLHSLKISKIDHEKKILIAWLRSGNSPNSLLERAAADDYTGRQMISAARR
jgi:hypothetical protein